MNHVLHLQGDGLPETPQDEKVSYVSQTGCGNSGISVVLCAVIGRWI